MTESTHPYVRADLADPVEDEIVTWLVTICKTCGRRIRQLGGSPDSAWRHLTMNQVYCTRPAQPLPLDLDDD